MANMNNNMNDINTTCISDEDKYWEEFDKAMNAMRVLLLSMKSMIST
jgi:hypothetical protein